MAITRTQIAKQLLEQGGRVGFKNGPAGGASSGGNYSGSTKSDDKKGSNKGLSGVDIGFQRALDRQTARQNEITQSQNPDFGQFFGTRVPIYQKPTISQKINEGLGNFLTTKGGKITKSIIKNLVFNKLPLPVKAGVLAYNFAPKSVQEQLKSAFLSGPTITDDDDEITTGEGGQNLITQQNMKTAPTITLDEPIEPEITELAQLIEDTPSYRYFNEGGSTGRPSMADIAGPATTSAPKDTGGNGIDIGFQRALDKAKKNQITNTLGGGIGNDGGSGITKSNFKKDMFTPVTNFSKFNFKDIINLPIDDDSEDEDTKVADVSAIDINRLIGAFGKPKYNPNQNIQDIRDFERDAGFEFNPTLTDEEIRGILNKTITEPTGQFAKDGGRIGLMEGGMPYEGGIMDLESARQMYGLGKLVKKIGRTVKKIAKSDAGKAALLAAGAYYFSPASVKAGTKEFLFGLPSGRDIVAPTKGLFGKGGEFALGEGKLGIGSLISGASLLSGLITSKEKKDEDEDETDTGEGLDITGIRRNPQGFLAPRFMAEGGSTEKEPVAKKVMPLIDMDGKEKDYRETGGFVDMGRMEKADDVPARLSKNEFVFTADAVRNAGEGNVDKGAEVMYNMMKNLEAGGEVSEESQGLEGARKMFKTSQRLEEVL